LRDAGQLVEAAAVYREAASLARQYAKYAVGTAERKRRMERAKELEELADDLPKQKPSAPARQDAQQAEQSDELQAQIEALITRADVTWDDIGGLDGTKREIQTAFGLAMARKPDGMKIDVVGNVLLYGPPGTGKSLLAAAVSNGLEATFFNVSASKLLSKWFGESPRLISKLYGVARERSPSMVFIDELEALFPSRESSTTGAERRVLSTLLAELSGVATSGKPTLVFTIGATNAPWLMDSAALSRFGRRIYVPLPDAAARRAILEVHFVRNGHKLAFPLDQLVEATDGLSGRQLAHVAASAVEKMLAEANPDLGKMVAKGNVALAEYQLATRPLEWGDVEGLLARAKPDVSAEAIKRYESW
jgi:SpoVK/Ycf46/Vps4 family AAA+-type ATPase